MFDDSSQPVVIYALAVMRTCGFSGTALAGRIGSHGVTCDANGQVASRLADSSRRGQLYYPELYR
jgi:hypothetical protein